MAAACALVLVLGTRNSTFHYHARITLKTKNLFSRVLYYIYIKTNPNLGINGGIKRTPKKKFVGDFFIGPLNSARCALPNELRTSPMAQKPTNSHHFTYLAPHTALIQMPNSIGLYLANWRPDIFFFYRHPFIVTAYLSLITNTIYSTYNRSSITIHIYEYESTVLEYRTQ